MFQYVKLINKTAHLTKTVIIIYVKNVKTIKYLNINKLNHRYKFLRLICGTGEYLPVNFVVTRFEAVHV